jgi:hypothetical protein
MNASIATGYTNTTQGLFWGWELIDNGGLFDAAGPFNNSYKKVIIMITDGYPTMYKNSYGSPYENQFDPLNDDPGTSSNVVSNLVDRYKKLCTEIKNSQTGKDVIQIYAIGVDSENPYEKECVNSADNYFSVSSSALANKLADIAKKIGKVSIAE